MTHEGETVGEKILEMSLITRIKKGVLRYFIRNNKGMSTPLTPYLLNVLEWVPGVSTSVLI